MHCIHLLTCAVLISLGSTRGVVAQFQEGESLNNPCAGKSVHQNLRENLASERRLPNVQRSQGMNPTEWQAAAGQWTTIDFTGHAWGEIVGESYASIGVHFPELDDSFYFSDTSFADNWGLQGSFAFDPEDSISILFDTPQYAVAVHHPGSVQIEIYADDTFLFTTEDLTGGFLYDFTGLISTVPFNKVRIIDPAGFVFIDDLHFGGVPAPSALPLLGALLIQSRRRRP